MLNPAMNNAKWNELCLEMSALELRPAYSILCTNGRRSDLDREWFYHLRDKENGFSDILHLNILTDTPAQREAVRSILKKIHIPGTETPEGFLIFGYLEDGQTADFI